MIEFKSLSFTNNGSIWTCKINRPQALNALNNEVLDELAEVAREVKRMDLNKCRVLLITGEGEKAFVAGADIKEIQSLKENRDAIAFSEKGQAVLREFDKLFVPVIAVVNGFCLGGGLELALACDFILASENAKFGLPEVGLGLIPGFGGTVRLARVVGVNRAREMIFTGGMISATEAHQMNLVSKVFPLAQLQGEAQKISEAIAAKGPLAIALAKRSVQKALDQDIDQGLRSEAKQFGELFSYQDTREGLKAFVDKRAANFQAK